jgi:hypothetical protein
LAGILGLGFWLMRRGKEGNRKEVVYEKDGERVLKPKPAELQTWTMPKELPA